MNRPAIKSEVKRELRQESKFGCVMCGSPIIEYHHINPYHKVKQHEKDNLVVLCPECHHRANCGEIPIEVIKSLKENPKNNNSEYVKKNFFLRKYETLKFSTGNHLFENVPIILMVDKVPLVYFNIDDNGFPLLNAKFYDQNNNLKAEIKNNEWIAYNSSEFWDIKYSPGNLKILTEKRKIFIEMNVLGEEVELKSTLFYNGKKVNLDNKPMVAGGATIGKIVIKNSQVGIAVS